MVLLLSKNGICVSNFGYCSLHDELYRYSNTLPPLPAQHSHVPPPTLYPEQLMHISDSNYNYQRFPMPDLKINSKINRADINV